MKILFLGTHGQFNIGDELLLETFLAQLGGGHQYAVNSYDPPFTQNAMRPKFNVESFHTTRTAAFSRIFTDHRSYTYRSW